MEQHHPPTLPRNGRRPRAAPLTCSLFMSSGASPSTIGVPVPFPFFLGAFDYRRDVGKEGRLVCNGFASWLAGSLQGPCFPTSTSCSLSCAPAGSTRPEVPHPLPTVSR